MKKPGAPDDLASPSLFPAAVHVATHGLLWLVFLATAYAVVPRFEAMFADYGVNLPLMSVAAIRVSHFVIRFLLVFPVLLVILGVVDTLVLLVLRSRRDQLHRARLWTAIMLALPLAATAALLAAILVPWVGVMSRLKG